MNGSSSSLWTTPQHHDSAGGSPERVRRYGTLHGAANLADDVTQWPTPSAAVMNDGESLASWEARRERNLAKSVNGNGMGTPLTIAAQAWPTPQSADGERQSEVLYRRGENLTLLGAARRFPSSPPVPPTAPPGPPSSPPGPTSPPLWPTPVQEDSQVTGWRPNKDASGQRLNATAQLWQTPATDSFRSRGGERKDEQGLDQQARGFWPTPTHTRGRNHTSGRSNPESAHHDGHTLEDAIWEMALRLPPPKRRLNPRFVAWLMGLPPRWLDAQSSCGPAEMASYRSRLRTHLRCLLGDSALNSAAD